MRRPSGIVIQSAENGGTTESPNSLLHNVGTRGLDENNAQIASAHGGNDMNRKLKTLAWTGCLRIQMVGDIPVC